MNKNGYTLIELIASISLLALIALIAFPSILNMLKKGQDKIDTDVEKIVEVAASEYVNDHKNDFSKPNSEIFAYKSCIAVDTLYENGYIEDSVYEKYKTSLSTSYVGVCANQYKYKYIYDSSKCNTSCS